MQPIESRLDTGGEAYQANRDFMQGYVEKVRAVERNIRASEERYRERAARRGKLLPRERWPTCSIRAHRFWNYRPSPDSA